MLSTMNAQSGITVSTITPFSPSARHRTFIGSWRV
jgi:hypothetical protein